MMRIAKPSDPQRIADLKRKIDTAYYLNNAIAGIATILTHGLLEWNGTQLEEENGTKKQQRK
jgi:hypothetical protein